MKVKVLHKILNDLPGMLKERGYPNPAIQTMLEEATIRPERIPPSNMARGQEVCVIQFPSAQLEYKNIGLGHVELWFDQEGRFLRMV